VRASTFFALFIAILIGLAAVASARYFGLFQTAPPEKTVAVVRPEPLPRVLVAKKNLYADVALSTADVQVRELRPDELSAYNANKDDYMPPTVEAAAYRSVKKNLPAGKILVKADFENQALPPGPALRLTPTMRAVNVVVPKDRAAGGLIRVGDFVDVYLTTDISGGKDTPAVTRTAAIARDLCVIIKRDNPFDVLAPVTKEIPFTLEANPYRAALIEYAKDRGHITLVPTATPPRTKDAKPQAPESFSIKGSKEYMNEDQRVAAVLAGDRSVGGADLERIFGLPPLPVQETLLVELLNGNTVKKSSQITRQVALNRPVDPDQPGFGYRFSPPVVAAEAAPAQAPFPRPLTTKQKQP
jgi:Flp pilus assembly protein CpaB